MKFLYDNTQLNIWCKTVLQAKEAIEESLKSDPTCAHAQFISFRVALLENDSKKGKINFISEEKISDRLCS